MLVPSNQIAGSFGSAFTDSCAVAITAHWPMQNVVRQNMHMADWSLHPSQPSGVELSASIDQGVGEAKSGEAAAIPSVGKPTTTTETMMAAQIRRTASLLIMVHTLPSDPPHCNRRRINSS